MGKPTTIDEVGCLHAYEQWGLLFNAIAGDDRGFLFNPIMQCKNCKSTKVDLENLVLELK
jgi:hypothetical protein